MANKNKISTIVFSVYILLAFYVFGGGIVNSLVAYRTWRAVGANEFPEFHHIDSSLIIPLFVSPCWYSTPIFAPFPAIVVSFPLLVFLTNLRYLPRRCCVY